MIGSTCIRIVLLLLQIVLSVAHIGEKTRRYSAWKIGLEDVTFIILLHAKVSAMHVTECS